MYEGLLLLMCHSILQRSPTNAVKSQHWYYKFFFDSGYDVSPIASIAVLALCKLLPQVHASCRLHRQLHFKLIHSNRHLLGMQPNHPFQNHRAHHSPKIHAQQAVVPSRTVVATADGRAINIYRVAKPRHCRCYKTNLNQLKQ